MVGDCFPGVGDTVSHGQEAALPAGIAQTSPVLDLNQPMTLLMRSLQVTSSEIETLSDTAEKWLAANPVF